MPATLHLSLQQVILFDDARGLYLKIGRDALRFSKDKKRNKKMKSMQPTILTSGTWRPTYRQDPATKLKLALQGKIMLLQAQRAL